MSQCRGQQHAARFAHHMLVRPFADGLRRHGRAHGTRIAFLGGEDARTVLGRLEAPSRLPIEHVHGVARRERRQRRKPGIGETAQSLHPGAAARHFGHRARLRAQRVPHPALECRQVRRRRPIGIAQRELRRECRKTLRAAPSSAAASARPGKAVRQRRLSGMALRGPTHEPVLPVEVHFAVAAEDTLGAHIDRLHHGAPCADQRALAADHRPAAGHHRDVGGGTAHVRDDEVLQAGEEARADDARRRPRQNRLARGYSSAISAFISEPSPFTIISGALMDSSASTCDRASIKCPDLRRAGARSARPSERAAARRASSSIRERRSPAWRRQGANQLAAARNSCAGLRHCGKIGRHGECLDPRLMCSATARSCTAASIWSAAGLLAGRDMAALHPKPTRPPPPGRFAVPNALTMASVETDQQRAHRAEAIFDDGDSSGQRGRDGHQTHVLCGPAPCRKQVQHRAYWPWRCRWPRFQGVVSALALAMTRRPPASSTASVNVHRRWSSLPTTGPQLYSSRSYG